MGGRLKDRGEQQEKIQKAGDSWHFHLEERDHQCFQCGKRFQAQPALTKVGQFMCLQCGKRFQAQPALTKVDQFMCLISTGTDECPICCKNVFYLQHMKRHTTTREFACHICGKAFAVKTDMKGECK